MSESSNERILAGLDRVSPFQRENYTIPAGLLQNITDIRWARGGDNWDIYGLS